MDAVIFIQDYARMCESYEDCGDCPIFGGCMGSSHTKSIWVNDIHRIIDVVDEWSKAHPIKTRLTDFLEKLPKAPRREDGVPLACVQSLGYTSDCCGFCRECWNTSLEE